jgi:hypothetical protein
LDSLIGVRIGSGMRGRVEAKAIAAHHGLSGLRDVFFGDASRVLGRFHDQRGVGVQVGGLPNARLHHGRDQLEVGCPVGDDVSSTLGDDGEGVISALSPDAEAVVGGIGARRGCQQVARVGEDLQNRVHNRAVANAAGHAGSVEGIRVERVGLGPGHAGAAGVATVEVATGKKEQEAQSQCAECRG